MWRCNCCGATFDKPYTKTLMENLDGENGWWRHTEAYCPECSDEQIEEEHEEVYDDDLRN